MVGELDKNKTALQMALSLGGLLPPSGHGWFCERDVVITCVPGTAPVGKRVYFYRHHIVKEKTERNGKRLSSDL